MDLSYVFSNHEDWKTKVVEKGLTVQHLYDFIKDVAVIIGNLRNDEIEDFVFRLKLCHDKLLGKTCDPDEAYRTPMRVSVGLGSRVFYFKLSPSESVFLRQKSRYFCETCGINNTFKIKSMRTHVERVHAFNSTTTTEISSTLPERELHRLLASVTKDSQACLACPFSISLETIEATSRLVKTSQSPSEAKTKNLSFFSKVLETKSGSWMTPIFFKDLSPMHLVIANAGSSFLPDQTRSTCSSTPSKNESVMIPPIFLIRAASAGSLGLWSLDKGSKAQFFESCPRMHRLSPTLAQTAELPEMRSKHKVLPEFLISISLASKDFVDWTMMNSRNERISSRVGFEESEIVLDFKCDLR